MGHPLANPRETHETTADPMGPYQTHGSHMGVLVEYNNMWQLYGSTANPSKSHESHGRSTRALHTHGNPMGTPWEPHGRPISQLCKPWTSHGSVMGTPYTHGSPIESYGMPMRVPWTTLEVRRESMSQHYKPMGVPGVVIWGYHDPIQSRMRDPWGSHGRPMQVPWETHAGPMGQHYNPMEFSCVPYGSRMGIPRE